MCFGGEVGSLGFEPRPESLKGTYANHYAKNPSGGPTGNRTLSAQIKSLACRLKHLETVKHQTRFELATSEMATRRSTS